MTTYKSYAECKIANPDSEIVTSGKNWDVSDGGCECVGTFEPLTNSHEISGDRAWVICNPADYCSSLKEFFDAGFSLVSGDKIIGTDKGVFDIVENSEFNYPDRRDNKRYILSASALNGGCKIPAKAEQWTIYNNTLSLCKLTDEQYGKMRRMHDAGMDVEWRSFVDARWEPIFNPSWNADGVYRIKQKSERELFIDAAVSTFDGRTGLSAQAMSLAAQLMFDSEKFKRVIKDGE